MVTRTVLRSVAESMQQSYAAGLPSGDQIHLPQQLLDADTCLFALAAEVVQFLAKLPRVGYGRVTLRAEGGHHFHGAVNTLFKTGKGVVVFFHAEPLRFTQTFSSAALA